MDKIDFIKEFSYRLRDAMQNAGFSSSRSPSGVCTQELADMTGYSVQICRRYLRGKALPEMGKIIEIARKLNVSPGWLVFGDREVSPQLDNNSIIINKELFRQLFSKMSPLFADSTKLSSVTDFILRLLGDLSLMQISEEQKLKVIDLAIHSANCFKSSDEI